MDKVSIQGSDSDDDIGLLKIDELNHSESISPVRVSPTRIHKKFTNTLHTSLLSTGDSPCSDETPKVDHFKHFHPIGDKFKLIKLKSVPLDVKLGISNKSSWKLSDNYELLQHIGFGAYSEVWLAKRISDDSQVAVKIAKGTTSINLLKNEADILKKLQSEYFPKFYEYQVNWLSNRSYLIMEYIQGFSLTEASSHPEIQSNALDYIKDLVCAVAELHSMHIAHRDLKPENVIVESTGALKLIDFNISKQWSKQNKIFDTTVSAMYRDPPQSYRYLPQSYRDLAQSYRDLSRST